MIITAYGLIVFQLAVWIGFDIAKPRKATDGKYGIDLLGFAYPAIPTRHEVPAKPMLAILVSGKATELLKHEHGLNNEKQCIDSAKLKSYAIRKSS